MSIKVLENASKHPARDAAIQSITCVQKNDREGWLAIWDEDGIIEDPVGPSPLDPTGEGHRGMENIKAFYDKVIAPGEIRFEVRLTFAGGNECASVGTITTKSAQGIVGRTEMVAIHKVNEQGKLVSLRAFWEFPDTIASMF